MEFERCFRGDHLLLIVTELMTEDKVHKLCQLSFGWYLNLVGLRKVKCLACCKLYDCTYNLIQ